VTTRDERTRHILQAGAFLKELRADTKLPKAIRREAIRLLRHYPTVMDLRLLAEIEKSVLGCGLLTPEFDPSWITAYKFGAHFD